MTFAKQRLTEAEQGYSVASLPLLGTECLLAAAEGPGPGLVFPVPELKPSVLASGPGGCMGFAPVPGRDDAVLMITGFYPIFKAESAGVHLYTAVDGFGQPWAGRRVLDLPFVHRIATVSIGGAGHLVAATVCGGKDYREDWSRPGKVYVARIPEDQGDWEATPVLEGIHQNHGMNVGTYKGRQVVFISGTEGVYALFVPDRVGDPWQSEQLLNHQISEVFPYDLDGDGTDELAVIEPFHGDTLGIYKQIDARWERVFAAPLGFGHGLWAGKLGGLPAVIVGNRAGTKNLCCYRVRSSSLSDMEEIVVDAASGTTNMAVVEFGGREAVLASNPEYGEYAIYDVRDE